jgi:hypothetical protein
MIEELSRREVVKDGKRYMELTKRKKPIFDEREACTFAELVEIN